MLSVFSPILYGVLFKCSGQNPMLFKYAIISVTHLFTVPPFVVAHSVKMNVTGIVVNGGER